MSGPLPDILVGLYRRPLQKPGGRSARCLSIIAGRSLHGALDGGHPRHEHNGVADHGGAGDTLDTRRHRGPYSEHDSQGVRSASEYCGAGATGRHFRCSAGRVPPLAATAAFLGTQGIRRNDGCFRRGSSCQRCILRIDTKQRSGSCAGMRGRRRRPLSDSTCNGIDWPRRYRTRRFASHMAYRQSQDFGLITGTSVSESTLSHRGNMFRAAFSRL
jgi:hypothetical protein